MRRLAAAFAVSCVALVVLVALPRCGDDDTDPVVDVIDTVETLDASEVTAGETDSASLCCPIAETPSCDCFASGGSVAAGCHSICDAPPTGWTRTTDANGCPVWTGGGAGSCHPLPDTSDTSDVDDTGDADDTAAATDTGGTEVADDTAVATDTTGDTSAPPTDPWVGLAGRIEIVEVYSGGAGEVVGGHILIELNDRVPPTRLALVDSEGACRLWVQSDAPCPACDDGTMCGADGTCQPSASPVSAGTITFSGLVAAFTATPTTPIPYYTIVPDPPFDGLFDKAASIAVDVAGAEGFPGLATSVTGVSDLAIGTNGLVELYDDAPFELTWTPDGSDAEVEVVLQLGWHGAPPTARIVCTAPDAAGKVVIAARLIERFPYFGGLGLFQNPSWAERLTRSLVAGPHGPIEVRAASRVNLGVTHGASR